MYHPVWGLVWRCCERIRHRSCTISTLPRLIYSRLAKQAPTQDDVVDVSSSMFGVIASAFDDRSCTISTLPCRKINCKQALIWTVFIVWGLMSPLAVAWNALGHRLIAQIAYDALDKTTQNRLNAYNRALNTPGHRVSLINAGPWLDWMSDRTLFRSFSARESMALKCLGMKSKWTHYVDMPFSLDGTPTRPPKSPNAMTAIACAQQVFHDPHASRIDKGLSLRILIHVVGDLHQPLHAADQISRRYPTGDHGGNLFPLGRNLVAPNLHAYWDRGGGLLLSKRKITHRMLQQMAAEIERKWPCRDGDIELSEPNVWRDESFNMAVHQAYALPPYSKPGNSYQAMVQQASAQRIALAGCRLAQLLR